MAVRQNPRRPLHRRDVVAVHDAGRRALRIIMGLRMEHGDQREGLRVLTELAALLHEFRHFAKPFHAPRNELPGTQSACLVDLHVAARRKQHSRLLLKHFHRFHDPRRRGIAHLGRLAERPQHDVPRLVAIAQPAGLATAAVKPPDPAVVAADPIRRNGRIAWIAQRLQPVGTDLHVRLVRMDGLRVFRHVFHEAFPLEVHPRCPIRIFFGDRRFRDSRAFLELSRALLAIAWLDRPQIAVDPEAIDIITVDQFNQLRNQQFLQIGAARTHFIRLAVRTRRGHDGPFRMLLRRRHVPNAGIMAVKRQFQLFRRLAPLRHRILHDARRHRPVRHLRKPAGHARMAFAVRLHEIRLHDFQHRNEFRRTAMRAQFRIVGVRMQVIMHAEIIFLPVPVSTTDLHDFLLFIIWETHSCASGHTGV